MMHSSPSVVVKLVALQRICRLVLGLSVVASGKLMLDRTPGWRGSGRSARQLVAAAAMAGVVGGVVATGTAETLSRLMKLPRS